jgi:hypothetical protein
MRKGWRRHATVMVRSQKAAIRLFSFASVLGRVFRDSIPGRVLSTKQHCSMHGFRLSLETAAHNALDTFVFAYRKSG